MTSIIYFYDLPTLDLIESQHEFMYSFSLMMLFWAVWTLVVQVIPFSSENLWRYQHQSFDKMLILFIKGSTHILFRGLVFLLWIKQFPSSSLRWYFHRFHHGDFQCWNLSSCPRLVYHSPLPHFPFIPFHFLISVCFLLISRGSLGELIIFSFSVSFLFSFYIQQSFYLFILGFATLSGCRFICLHSIEGLFFIGLQ